MQPNFNSNSNPVDDLPINKGGGFNIPEYEEPAEYAPP
jgi:hypothetical protein